jgi:hypothetical protein
VLYEVMKERGAWPHFQMVDVAVQGLRQSEDELRHAAKSPPKGLHNSLSRRYTEVRCTCPERIALTRNEFCHGSESMGYGIGRFNVILALGNV